MSNQPRVPAGSPEGGQFASKYGAPYISGKQGILIDGPPNEKTKEFTLKSWGRELSNEQLAQCAGVPPGSEVEIEFRPTGTRDMVGVLVYLRNPEDETDPETIGQAYRTFVKDKVYNEGFEIEFEWRGKGIGTKMLAEQVESAAANGFHSIETQAIGTADKKSGANGYYTWAVLGFDGKIPGAPGEWPHKGNLKGRGPNGETTVHEVLSKPGGVAWWKQHGESFSGEFDLTEGSVSRQVLAEYLRLKGSN
jgi:hypothetical protein